VRQLAQLAEELDAVKVVLRSATEPFDTGSAAGRMMLQMLAVFAEFEHATIVDRVTAGIGRRAREGNWATGRLPFGYRRDEQKRADRRRCAQQPGALSRLNPSTRPRPPPRRQRPGALRTAPHPH
jgi:DNA invertase Pin-like site-specific DNA recombinase